jgi:NDP-sugar pyrophosphorylase family protein
MVIYLACCITFLIIPSFFPEMKAVILAGGLGTRLQPLTYEIPKALIPIHGRTLTEHLFDLFKRHGVQDMIMAVGHMRDKIMSHYGDGKQFNINLSYAEEKEPLGTAGPLLLVKDQLTKPFFCSNGDELKDLDLDAMQKAHAENKKKGALATLALLEVEDPTQYGVARLDNHDASKILAFVEKPTLEEAPSKKINSGFYILEPEALDLIPEGFAMLEKVVFPQLAEQGKLFGFPFQGQWFDTGTMERYDTAIKNWKDINPVEHKRTYAH